VVLKKKKSAADTPLFSLSLAIKKRKERSWRMQSQLKKKKKKGPVSLLSTLLSL